MEILVLVLLVLTERARFDLHVRRWWAQLDLPRPALALRVPVPLALAGVDTRRMFVRVGTLGALFLVVRLFPLQYAPSVYDGVNHLIGFYFAFVGLLVLALVATNGGRDRGQELVAALPSGGRRLVLGWVVLLACGAILEYILVLVLASTGDTPPYRALLPDSWDLAQGPLMLLGGGLLGLLAARLLPGWAATPLCVVLAIVWVGVLSGTFSSTTMLAPVVEWVQYRKDNRVVFEPGSFAWHNAYLLGLCGLGVVAALLREPGRRRGLVIAGAGLLAATVTAGALAMP